MKWSIKEAAKHVEFTVHTVRYYEQEGLLHFVKRDQNGNRIFEKQDVEWLEFITCLRDTGMSIAEMRRIVEVSLEGDHTIPDRKLILEEHKQAMEKKLEEIKRAFEKIDHKISWYDMLEYKSKMNKIK
jgi:MerR family transcriptional regulator, aldehyde-responsive regulator